MTFALNPDFQAELGSNEKGMKAHLNAVELCGFDAEFPEDAVEEQPDDLHLGIDIADDPG